MHIGFVRQVHQVVDHQSVITCDVIETTTVCPLRILGPFEVMDQRRIGLFRVARPHPDESIAFLDREASNAWEALHALVRHGGSLAVAFHDQAVVAADQLSVLDETQRERRTPVGTEILYGRYSAFMATVEHDAFVADLSPQRLIGDFVRGAGDVPGVSRKHGDHSVFLF
ncbi:hypothetical protein FQZ97_629540 [compost metagenome]